MTTPFSRVGGAVSLESLRVERHGGCVLMTLDRPEVMNCLNTALVEAVEAALVELSPDRSVRAVVLTGAGDRAFCTGMDLKERAGLSASDIALQRRRLIGVLSRLHRLPQPTVAAVGGLAAGGGFELALCCDLIVAAETASFCLPEVRVGIMPAGGSTHTLTWLVGPARARDLIFTGRRIDARQAEHWGIVARLAPPGRAVAEALHLAEEIARGAPIGLRQAKAAVRRAQRSLAAALDDEDELYDDCLYSEDRQEGFAAFAEKRPPSFRGR